MGTLHLQSLKKSSGSDALGAYASTTVEWVTAAGALFTTSFRDYTAETPTLVFRAEWGAPSARGAPGGASSMFPSLVSVGAAPLGSLYQPPNSGNCGWTTAGSNVFPTPSDGLLVLSPHRANGGAPQLSLGFSAITNTATTRQVGAPAWAGGPPALSLGARSELDLHPGFATEAVLVASSAGGGDARADAAAALGLPPGGAGAALQALGDANLAAHGKARPTPESAGPIYTMLGYSGVAFYFYNPCDGGRWPNGTAPPGRAHMPPWWAGPCRTYADTHAAVLEGLSRSGVPPVGHVLLDSWWYGEGIFGGVSLWEDTPALMAQVQSFPAGLAAAVAAWPPGVVFWAHNGWFTSASPYLSQFPFSAGNIPQGRALWDRLLPRARDGWRLAQVKQDHVNDYLRAAGDELTNASTLAAWFGGLSDAAVDARVSLQFCCSPPRVLHMAPSLPAAVSARASPDYVANARGGVRPRYQWALGVESAFHYLGLGLLPDKDSTLTNASAAQHGGDGAPAENAPPFYNFSEVNAAKHLLHAALSWGPVSFGDAAGAGNATLLHAVCRADGTVLRASRPAVAVEGELYSIMWGSGAGGPGARADASLPNGGGGEVYATVASVGARTWTYVVASQLPAPYALQPHDVGLPPADAQALCTVWWDVSTFAPARGAPVAPAFAGGAPVAVHGGAAYEDAPALLLLAPRIESGGTWWVLLGEVGKLVPVSPQRLAAVEPSTRGALTVVLRGGGDGGAPAGEAVMLAACVAAGAADGCGEVRNFACTAPGTCELVWS